MLLLCFLFTGHQGTFLGAQVQCGFIQRLGASIHSFLFGSNTLFESANFLTKLPAFALQLGAKIDFKFFYTRLSFPDNGRGLAFRSDCDLIPGQNPSGVPQLFHYFEVDRSDAIYSPLNCRVEDGCCNVENGCYTPLYGRKVKVRRARIRPPWGKEGGD